MKGTGLVYAPNPWINASEAGCIYDSPSLKIHTCKMDPGQSLLMDSRELRGKVSLVVIEGYGECVVERDGTYPIQTGDIVISETTDPHRLLALTDLRLLVTFAPAECSCTAPTP